MIEAAITAAGMVTPEGAGGSARPWRCWAEIFGGAPVAWSAFKWGDLFEPALPRFGRMDPLCRLGLAAVEMMGVDFAAMAPARREGTGICVATTTGCVEADAEFWRGNLAGEPSPAMFIYTLPSSPLAEIAIRHKLQGPNLCLPCAPDRAAEAAREAAGWIASGEAEAAVCVYVNALGEASRAVAAGIPELAAAPEGAWAMFIEAEAAAASRAEARRVPEGEFDFIKLCAEICGGA